MRKPRRCPGCKHSPVATVLYGMPSFDADVRRKVEEGRIVFGGCSVTRDDPAWQCSACSTRIWRDGRMAAPES